MGEAAVDTLRPVESRRVYEPEALDAYYARADDYGRAAGRVLMSPSFGLSESTASNVVSSVQAFMSAVRYNPDLEIDWNSQQQYFEDFVSSRLMTDEGRAWVDLFDEPRARVAESLEFAWRVLRYAQPEFMDSQRMDPELKELVALGGVIENAYQSGSGMASSLVTTDEGLDRFSLLDWQARTIGGLEQTKHLQARLYEGEGKFDPIQVIHFRELFRDYLAQYYPDKRVVLQVAQHNLGREEDFFPHEYALRMVGLNMNSDAVSVLQKNFYEFMQGLRETNAYRNTSGDDFTRLVGVHAAGESGLRMRGTIDLQTIASDLDVGDGATAQELLVEVNNQIESLSIEDLQVLSRLIRIRSQLTVLVETGTESESGGIVFGPETLSAVHTEALNSPEMSPAEVELYESLLTMYRKYFLGELGKSEIMKDSCRIVYDVVEDNGARELKKTAYVRVGELELELHNINDEVEPQNLRDYLSQVKEAMEEVAFLQAMHEYTGQMNVSYGYLRQVVDRLSVVRRWFSPRQMYKYRSIWLRRQPSRGASVNHKVISVSVPEEYDHDLAEQQHRQLVSEGGTVPYPPDDGGKSRYRRFLPAGFGSGRIRFEGESVVELSAT